MKPFDQYTSTDIAMMGLRGRINTDLPAGYYRAKVRNAIMVSGAVCFLCGIAFAHFALGPAAQALH